MSANINKTLTVNEVEVLQDFVNTTDRTEAQIRRRIESLPLSADLKALLGDLLRVTTRIGETVLRIGRKILDFVFTVILQFPALSFTIVVAGVLTLLVSMVPLIGGVLASTLGPLLMALGVASGAAIEIQSADLRQRIVEFVNSFKKVLA
jgi:hypothetical protein